MKPGGTAKRPPVKQGDILRIAAESHRDPRTVQRVLTGQGNPTANTKESVEEAARKLGIRIPGED